MIVVFIRRFIKVSEIDAESNFPTFFRTGTRLETHWVCLTGKIILAFRNLFNSFWTVDSSLGCIFLNFCWKGKVWGFIGMTCCMMLGSKVLRSSYIHAKTSLNYLNNWINTTFSCLEHPIPRLMHCGLSLVLKFTFSYDNEELLVLQLIVFFKFILKIIKLL